MALVKTFATVSSKQVRRHFDGTSKTGCGKDLHMLVGTTGAYVYHSLIKFTHDWSGVKRVIKAEIVLQTEDDSSHFTFGTKPRIACSRLTAGFSDGSNAENVWTSGEYQWPAATGAVYADIPLSPTTGKPLDEARVYVDVTSLIKPIVPKTILMVDGTAGGGLTNYGFVFKGPGNETADTNQRSIFHSKEFAPTDGYPFLRLTYDPVNRAPVAPTLIGPATTNVTFADSFVGQHSDPDLDQMAAREIVVYPTGGSTPTWTLPATLQAAGSDEVPTGRFSVPLSLATGALKLQTNYEWVARTKDPSGLWGPYSARRALRITSSAPTITPLSPGSVAEMRTPRFGGGYTDPENDDLDLFHLQMQPTAGLNWSDPSRNVWDTGEVRATAEEVDLKRVARAYGGSAIPAADYTFRVQVRDDTGVWSTWASATFTLTADFNPDPGAIDLITQVARVVPTRIAVYAISLNAWTAKVTATGGTWKLTGNGTTTAALAYNISAASLKTALQTMWPGSTATVTLATSGSTRTYTITFPGSSMPVIGAMGIDGAALTGTGHAATLTCDAPRGIGPLVGYVDDPINLGISAYMNGGGELYFTLPALHPYCPVLEPRQVHAHVEQYWGDRYVVRWAGIITDFDATPDEMTFYGTDYLGLLQTAVDERYDPANINKAAPAGSKYIDQTIDAVIRDQVTYHRDRPNSPVGFISVGSITALAERVTIYSTYSECLPFIGGLIDSHKQGTGREARFYARPKDTSFQNWEWALVDNWGKDRPNVRLEYGGLLNDFRVVALGDFGTRVLAVGQKRGEVKVYRSNQTGGLDEADWGRVVQTRFYPDIVDVNDLTRRTKEAAAQLAKVGKRMALAIRADMLAPYDGWDLGDSIMVDIERGGVDTSGYGSGGFWTIYGVEWRYYPDGHSDLTLTVLPKKGLTPVDPDLIPSIDPGVPLEFTVGYQPPTDGNAFGSAIPLCLDTGLFKDAGLFYDEEFTPTSGKYYYDSTTGITYEWQDGTWVAVSFPPTVPGPASMSLSTRIVANPAGIEVANVAVKVT